VFFRAQSCSKSATRSSIDVLILIIIVNVIFAPSQRPCDPEDSQGLGIFALYLPRYGGGPVTASPLEAIEDSAAAGVVY
jgi:hypothetical protein